MPFVKDTTIEIDPITVEALQRAHDQSLMERQLTFYAAAIAVAAVVLCFVYRRKIASALYWSVVRATALVIRWTGAAITKFTRDVKSVK